MGEITKSRTVNFENALDIAAGLPGVRIDRAAFLRAALTRHCSDEKILQAVEETPAAAGIPLSVLKQTARESIRWETTKVTALSAAAGLPGGLALIGTIPLDLAQYLGHILRIAQKLAYLYSWPDLFAGEPDSMPDETKGALTLFVGVMFGAQIANGAVAKLSLSLSARLAKTLPQKALTKGVLYPAVKKVSLQLGQRMTTQIFANSVSKVVPILGAIVSGGFTFATFLPMANRLDRHLSGLDLASKDSLEISAGVKEVEEQLRRATVTWERVIPIHEGFSAIEA